ncbi:hypothetical protein [Vibrio natriegens]|uniref:hypothetical protein n=1 Tax=Vibrio natriegens TaxID=691 RepID=UPI003F82A153
MKRGLISRWVVTALTFFLIGSTSVSAKPHNDPSVRPITQPGNKHQTRPVQRPTVKPTHPPSQHRPPSYHRPPNVSRPPGYHRPPSYHRPPVVIRPPKHHSTYIYVRSGHRYPPYRGHYYYYHRDLVDIATFAIFAGITYAIIQDAYYKKSGDRYVYVESPPAGNYTVIDGNEVVSYSGSNSATVTKSSSSTSTNVSPNSPFKKGEIVDSLPSTKKTVVVNGQTYFQYQNAWFLPLRDQRKYVVVESPL